MAQGPLSPLAANMASSEMKGASSTCSQGDSISKRSFHGSLTSQGAAPALQQSGALALSAEFNLALHLAQGPLPATFIVDDPIWSRNVITEPALIELLHSPAVQRLHTVLQHGITGLIDLTPRRVTRYEHSVGAMLIVRKLGGSVEAQAAALLHDVAHTALSHVADAAFGYVVHEDDKMEYLNTTSIPAMLDRLFGSHERVLEESNYTLLEQDAPRLCADRLDYGIRDSYAFGNLSLDQVERIRDDIVAVNGIICMKSIREARTLAYAYMKSDETAWAASTHGVYYVMAAESIRVAMDRGIITKADLWKHGDASFWRHLLECGEADVVKAAKRVRADVQIVLSQPGPEEIKPAAQLRQTGRRVLSRSYSAKELVVLAPRKLRTLDPDILLEDGTIKRLSELDPHYAADRQRYIDNKSGVAKYDVKVPDTPFNDAFLYK